MPQTYPNVSVIALCIIVPFASTYLCEAGFSALVDKNRNRLNVEDDLRLALTNVKPQISVLAKKLQYQPSHWTNLLVGELYKENFIRVDNQNNTLFSVEILRI